MCFIQHKCFLYPCSAVLEKAARSHGFASPYWIRKKTLFTLFGDTVRLTKDAVGVALYRKVSQSTFVYYNVTQTTDPATLAEFAAALTVARRTLKSPRNVITRSPYEGALRAHLLVQASRLGFQSPYWITKEELAALAMRFPKDVPMLLTGAVPTLVRQQVFLKPSWLRLYQRLTQSNWSSVIHDVELFNIEQTSNPSYFTSGSDFRSIDMMTGKSIQAHYQDAFHAHAARLKLQGNTWIALDDAESGTLGPNIRFFGEPLSVNCYDSNLISRKDVFYHTGQCLDIDSVLRCVRREPAMDLCTRSAFPAAQQRALCDFMDAHKCTSTIFARPTDLQRLFGVEVRIKRSAMHHYISVKVLDSTERLYHISQMTDQAAVSQYFCKEPCMTDSSGKIPFDGIFLARMQLLSKKKGFIEKRWILKEELKSGMRVKEGEVPLGIRKAVSTESGSVPKVFYFYNFDQITTEVHRS